MPIYTMERQHGSHMMIPSARWRAIGLLLAALSTPGPTWAAADLPVTKPLSLLPACDAGAVLSFSDEFTSLTATPEGYGSWKTRFYHGDRTLPANHEAQFYGDATTGDMPFHLRDNLLEIIATRAPGPGGLAYRSGLLNSQNLFSQAYGYFEIRAKLPAGRGLWPAFWLLPNGGGWPPEIDVFEMLGDQRNMIYGSVHWKEPNHKSRVHKIAVADTTTEFHIYGVSWHPDLIRWFFDGIEIARTPTPPGLDRPMYLLLNLAVGGDGSWPGAPDAATTFPARLQVDYVRAYRFNTVTQ